MFRKTAFFSISILCWAISNIGAVDTITRQEVKNISRVYIEVNNTKEYKYRYVPLPFHKNTLPWKWEGKEMGRIIALLEFERFVQENDLSSKNALIINKTHDPELLCMPHSQVTEWQYGKDSIKYDLHTVDLPERNYDFVMLNQVLEHLYDPIRCLKNVYKHLAPGAVLYLNAPAEGIPHMNPFHYYTGFTPMGLAVMIKLAGFDILSIGQWGNAEYLDVLHKTQKWPDYTYSETPGLNEIENPEMVWVFARKPG